MDYFGKSNDHSLRNYLFLQRLGTGINYRLTTPANGNVTTLTPVTEPPRLRRHLSSSITTSSYTSASLPLPASLGYIAIRAAGAAPTTDPVDGVTYGAGATLGDGIVALIGPGLHLMRPSCVCNSVFYKIYSFNGSGGTINYKTTLPLPGNVTTAVRPNLLRNRRPAL